MSMGPVPGGDDEARGLAGNHHEWTRDTTCPTCRGPAVYKRDKRRKIGLNCSNCGPLKYQARGGQALLEQRLRDELAGVSAVEDQAPEVSEPAPEATPETVPEPAAVEVPAEVPEASPTAPREGRKGLAVFGGLALFMGGAVWLAKTAQQPRR